MDIIIGVMGLVCGLGIGSLFVFLDSKSSIRTKMLINHLPHLPYLMLLYLILSVVVIALNYPYQLKIILPGMVGIESAMYILGRRLQKSLNK